MKIIKLLFIFLIIFDNIHCNKIKLESINGFWHVIEFKPKNSKGEDISKYIIGDMCEYYCYYLEKVDEKTYKFKSVVQDLSGNWITDNKYNLDAFYDSKNKILNIPNSECIAQRKPISFQLCNMKDESKYNMKTTYEIYAAYGNPNVGPPFGPDTITINCIWQQGTP